jgi:hypothetical protein
MSAPGRPKREHAPKRKSAEGSPMSPRAAPRPNQPRGYASYMSESETTTDDAG